MAKRWRRPKITCPHCGKQFRHNGKDEKQECPKCRAKLLIGIR